MLFPCCPQNRKIWRLKGCGGMKVNQEERRNEGALSVSWGDLLRILLTKPNFSPKCLFEFEMFLFWGTVISNKASNPGKDSAFGTKVLTHLGRDLVLISWSHPGDLDGVLAGQNTLDLPERELIFPSAALPELCWELGRCREHARVWEQCPSSPSNIPHLGVDKILGGNRDRTADPNWPRDPLITGYLLGHGS